MPLEFDGETIMVAFLDHLRCDDSITAGTSPRAVIGAIGADEDHNPEHSNDAVHEINGCADNGRRHILERYGNGKSAND